MRATRISEARYQAALLVEAKMWEMEQWGKVALEEPYSDILERPVRWDLKKIEPADKKTPWLRWDLTLDWRQGGRQESFMLKTYLPKK